VPLDELAALARHDTPGLLAHEGGKRRLVVGFNVRGRDLGVDAGRRAPRSTRSRDRAASASSGAGSTRRSRRPRGGWRWSSRLALALILIVLGLTFGRVAPALIVFGHVPFACVGGIAALTVRGLPLSVAAAVGFIALSGIAVMNGIVLMSEIRAREHAGAPALDAAVGAALARCRPVSMTAMVAALGFVPMALASGVGAEVQRPLATVVVGGLVSSTTLTLLVLPAIYPRLRRRAARSAT
jgi:cobalt-zinc-cadmium resistance protein CzcA